jgi:hypothetical protein
MNSATSESTLARLIRLRAVLLKSWFTQSLTAIAASSFDFIMLKPVRTRPKTNSLKYFAENPAKNCF